MEISPLLIYLIDVINSLCLMANCALIVSLVHTGFFAISGDKPKALKISIVVLAVSGLLTLFVPSKKVMIQMLVIPPIVNNEAVQELPQNILDFVNDYLKEAKESLKEKDL